MKPINRIKRGTKKDNSATTSLPQEGFLEGRSVHLSGPDIVNPRIFNIAPPAVPAEPVSERTLRNVGTDMVPNITLVPSLQGIFAGLDRTHGALPNNFGTRALLADYLTVYFGGICDVHQAPGSLLWATARGQNGRGFTYIDFTCELDHPTTRTPGHSSINYQQDITERVTLRTQLIVENNIVESFEAYTANIIAELTRHYGNCDWSITKEMNRSNTILIRSNITVQRWPLFIYVSVPDEIARLPLEPVPDERVVNASMYGINNRPAPQEDEPAPLLGGQRVFPPTYNISEHFAITRERMESIHREFEIVSRQMREAIESQHREAQIQQEQAPAPVSTDTLENVQTQLTADEVQVAHDHLRRHSVLSMSDVAPARRPSSPDMNIIGRARQSGRSLSAAPRMIHSLLDVQEALGEPDIQPVPVSERTMHDLLEEIHRATYGLEQPGMNPMTANLHNVSFDLENIARALNEPNNQTVDASPLRTEGEPRTLASVARFASSGLSIHSDLEEALGELYDDAQQRAETRALDPEALENRVPPPGSVEDTRYTDHIEGGILLTGFPALDDNQNRRHYSVEMMNQLLGVNRGPSSFGFRPVLRDHVEIDTEVSSPLDLSNGHFPTVDIQVRRERWGSRPRKEYKESDSMDSTQRNSNRSPVIRRSYKRSKDSSGNPIYPEVTNLHTALMRLTRLKGNKPLFYSKSGIIVERSAANVFLASPHIARETIPRYIKNIHEDKQKGIINKDISGKIHKVVEKYPNIVENICCPFCGSHGAGIKIKAVADEFEFMSTRSTGINSVIEVGIEYSLKIFVQCGYCNAYGPKISKRVHHNFTDHPIPDKLQRVEERLKEHYKTSYNKAVNAWVRWKPEDK